MIYYREVKENNMTYSVDMVRYKLKLKKSPDKFQVWNSYNPFTGENIREVKVYDGKNGQEEINYILQNEGLIGIGIYVDYYECHKPTKFRNLYNIRIANCNDSGKEESIVLGLGWNDFNYKIHPETAFIEFNPNKLLNDSRAKQVIQWIAAYIYKIELKRFDLAIDIPIETRNISLVKDKRTYELRMNSIDDKTEYLGQRNESGRVKLYNKSIEQNLNYPLTRLEITLDTKDYEDWISKIPKLNGMRSVEIPEDMDCTNRVLIELLNLVDNPNIYLKKLNKRKVEKIRPYCIGCDTVVTISKSVFENIKNTLDIYII